MNFALLLKSKCSFTPSKLRFVFLQEAQNDVQMLTVINMSDEEQIVKLPVWTANVPMYGTMERLMKITEERYNVGRIKYEVKDGIIELRMDPMSCKVLRCKK